MKEPTKKPKLKINRDNWMETTLELIELSSKTHRQICVGSDVKYRWLCNIVKGGVNSIKGPDVNKIERIYRHLKYGVAYGEADIKG